MSSTIKQITVSPELFRVRKGGRARTSKKKAPAELSSSTMKQIKENLIQRVQSHKINEVGELERIQSAKSATTSVVAPPVSAPPTNHLTDAVNYLNTIQKHHPALNKTVKHASVPYSTTAAAPSDPPYGILKGGSKPSYRDWSHTIKQHPTADSAPSVLPATPTLGAQSSIAEEKTTPTIMKFVRKRKHALGKTKGRGNVGVLVKNAKTRKEIIAATNEIQSKKIHDIKHDLFKKGIIRAGSTAPDDVLKNMYESSVLAGHVVNTRNQYQNLMDGMENH